jgi:hypothetical protein
MNTDQRELFRLAVLRVFGSNRTRFGLSVEAIRHLAGLFGFVFPGREETADAIDYLARKQLLEEIPKQISPENRVWRITGPGLAFLDEQGL